MKRGSQLSEDHHHNDQPEKSMTTIANYLILLSREGGATTSVAASNSRVFECKTCGRQFRSFQALGGHRASHKKPRFVKQGAKPSQQQAEPPKPKTHECSICGLEFAIGQALGGHMRRHRLATPTSEAIASEQSRVTELSAPSSEKSSNGRALCLDLNLPPTENGLDFPRERVAHMVHSYP
ncbi:hypothetical protein NMG60_11012523 [Bertholletia excelsa]